MILIASSPFHLTIFFLLFIYLFFVLFMAGSCTDLNGFASGMNTMTSDNDRMCLDDKFVVCGFMDLKAKVH